MNQIDMYFASKRVSNSMLKMLTNPRLLKLKKENPEIEDEEKSHLTIGSAVDCLLTSPERFNKDFKVVEVSRPYGLMGKFISALKPGISPSLDSSHYQEAYIASGYKMPIEWVISKFWKDDKNIAFYTQTIDVPKGVKIISADEMSQVNKIVELILANPYTEPYFVNYSVECDLMHQVPIYFVYEEVECKALMDGILIDHSLKKIVPFDLKTTGRSVYDFADSFVGYGYFRQASFYEQALLSPQSPVLSLLTDGYYLDDFKFIVVETKQNSTHPAVIYNTSEKDRDVGLNGGYYAGKYYKGINQLIDDYKWHVEHDLWDMPRELYLSGGNLKLDVFT